MKNKIAICLGLLTILFSVAKAQESTTEFGIHAGGTLSSYKVSQENVSVTSDSRFGFTVGAFASVNFTPNLSFQPELNFSQLGGNFNQSGLESKVSYYYLQLPLNVIYHFQEKQQGFFAGAGPTLAYGLSGTSKISSGQGESGDEDVHFGSGSDDDLKPFEFGLNFLAGYRLEKGIVFTANYNFGLNNISNSSEATYHNSYFGLTVGYMFH